MGEDRGPQAASEGQCCDREPDVLPCSVPTPLPSLLASLTPNPVTQGTAHTAAVPIQQPAEAQRNTSGHPVQRDKIQVQVDMCGPSTWDLCGSTQMELWDRPRSYAQSTLRPKRVHVNSYSWKAGSATQPFPDLPGCGSRASLDPPHAQAALTLSSLASISPTSVSTSSMVALQQE